MANAGDTKFSVSTISTLAAKFGPQVPRSSRNAGAALPPLPKAAQILSPGTFPTPPLRSVAALSTEAKLTAPEATNWMDKLDDVKGARFGHSVIWFS
jgi:hypothetical protein